MKKNFPSSNTLMDLMITSVKDVIQYAVQKKRYECELIVREKLAEIRDAKFISSATECADVTRQLNLYKTKLELLELQIAEYPDDFKEICRPLIDELKNKIFACRIIRKTGF